MNITLFQAYTEFATISLAVAAGYIGLIWVATSLANLLLRLREKATEFDSVCRPGEIVHLALRVTGRWWDHCRTALLLFGVSFFLLVNFGRYGWWIPLPTILVALIAVALSTVAGYILFRVWLLTRQRKQLNSLLDTHNEIARRLVEAQYRGNRVYYSVQLDGTVLDNVVVGRNGVYTLQLFVPPLQSETVTLASGGLIFQPGGHRLPLQAHGSGVRELQAALSAETGSKVIVQPVAVIPKCCIEPSDHSKPMLVNVQTCTSFVGWEEQGAFLLDDDVAVISAWLAGRSLLKPPLTVRQATQWLPKKNAGPGVLVPT
jgi:hypothetical protein